MMGAQVKREWPSDTDWLVGDEMKARLLSGGCPGCGAPARQVRTRPAHAGWRLHFRCGAQIFGVLGGAQVSKGCQRGGGLEGLTAALSQLETRIRKELERRAAP
jgi:hypothetical protein